MSDKFDRDSISNTLIVAISLSLVCSIIVSSAALVLKPIQQQNEELFRQQIILEVAGLMEPGADVTALFEAIEERVVELESGEYAADADTSEMVAIPSELDLAGIGERARYVPVYHVMKKGEIDQVILPVYGKGLWSTMYGYLSVAPDGNATRGLQFYAHGETPGLGDQMDKEDWRAQWDSKQLYGDSDQPQVRVIKGLVPDGVDGGEHMIDGMSGATLTGNGITGLLQYWTGSHGFGPYLKNFRESS
ncbi:MAG: Na(+)-translocating NADH-quinone reductase subunit C [Woeseiaceae bacterium]|nr:Na(+)-translocating NADH-quinone reductase subunit C [Woeseiaceae bacterium]